ncbi:MAG: hypothetical protein IJT25_03400 [Clostridia bacterium]|nr:hypothetical protein [Clostridia bacterium]
MKKFILSLVMVLSVIFSAVFVFSACNSNKALKSNEITITASNKIYDGEQIAVSATSTSGETPTLMFKKASDPDEATSYFSEAPTNAGTYIVVATLLETSEYNGAVARKEFVIEQKEVTLSWSTLSASELVYSGNEKTLTATIENGLVSGDSCDVETSLTSGADNVNVGLFTFTAVLSNSNYKASNAQSGEYAITKADANVQINQSLNGTYNGNAKVLNRDTYIQKYGEEAVSVKYKVQGADDSTYVETAPINAGNYTVLVSIANSRNYSDGACTRNFTINKAAGYISIPNISKDYDNQDAVLSANVFAGDFVGGEITISYKESGAEDLAYTTTPFKNAGDYVVKVEISESDNYLACSNTRSFTISKIYHQTLRSRYKLLGETEWRANSTYFKVGDTIVLGLTVGFTDEVPTPGDITFDIVDTLNSTAQGYIHDGNLLTLTAVGNGIIRYQGYISETTNYYSAQGNGMQGLNVMKGDANVSIIADISCGYTGNSVSLTNAGYTVSNTEGNITIEYSVKDANNWSTTAPINVGEYTVRVSVSESDNYNAGFATADFTISKANPVYTVPTGLTATYGETLADVSLPAGFSWQESLTRNVGSAGEHHYHVVYDDGSGNYNVVSNIEVTLEVLKATPDYTVPTGIEFEYGDYIENSDGLPAGFVWNGGGEVGEVGEHIFLASYNPDFENYNTVENIEITVTVVKKQPSITIYKNLSKQYDSTPVELINGDYYCTNEDGVITIEYKEQGAEDNTYTTSAPSAVGEYVVRLSVSEDAHYKACTETVEFVIRGESNIMQVSLNPGLEFVINEAGKVESVNALNEDGNGVILSVNFKGKTEEEAIKSFIDYAISEGYLKEGANEGTLSISHSSDSFNLGDFKTVVDSYLSGKSVTISTTTSAIDKDALILEALSCLQEYTEEELNEKSASEILNLIAEVRVETTGFASEDIKNIYYLARAHVLLVSKIEVIRDTIMAEDSETYADLIENLSELINNINNALNNYEEIYKNMFLRSSSPFVVANCMWANAKTTLLNAKASGMSQEIISTLEEALSNAEQAVSSAKAAAQSATEALLMVLNSVTEGFDAFAEEIEDFENNYDVIDTEVVVNSAKTRALSEFKLYFSEYLNNSVWNISGFKAEGYSRGVYVDSNKNKTYSLNIDYLVIYYNEEEPENSIYDERHVCYVYDGIFTYEEIDEQTPSMVYLWMEDNESHTCTVLTMDLIPLVLTEGNNIREYVVFSPITLEGNILYILAQNFMGQDITIVFNDNSKCYMFEGLHTQEQIESGSFSPYISFDYMVDGDTLIIDDNGSGEAPTFNINGDGTISINMPQAEGEIAYFLSVNFYAEEYYTFSFNDNGVVYMYYGQLTKEQVEEEGGNILMQGTYEINGNIITINDDAETYPTFTILNSETGEIAINTMGE